MGKLSGLTVDQDTENMLHSESQHDKVNEQQTTRDKKRVKFFFLRRLKLPIRIGRKSKQHNKQGTQNIKKSRETNKAETMMGEKSDKQYADTNEWRPKKGNAAPKPSLLKNMQYSHMSLDSLTAPKSNFILLPNHKPEVKLVHRDHTKEVAIEKPLTKKGSNFCFFPLTIRGSWKP